MRQRGLPTDTVRRAMRAARRDGFRAISFTGGEPTIRPDLLPLIREARTLGYESIKVQTNGLVFAEPNNLERLLDAGTTEIHLSIHTHLAEAYDDLVRREGAYARMKQAAANLAGVSDRATVFSDLVVLRSTLPVLADAVDWCADLGFTAGHLWYYSATDEQAGRTDQMPRFEEAMPSILAAFERAAQRGFDLRSLHIPHCLLGRFNDQGADPTARTVRVATPDAVFDLADSPLTPNARIPACVDCPRATRCRGVRRDYLAQYGDAEMAHARGQARTLLPVVSG
jgi:cyclic pyranopterin phosphate synthase